MISALSTIIEIAVAIIIVKIIKANVNQHKQNTSASAQSEQSAKPVEMAETQKQEPTSKTEPEPVPCQNEQTQDVQQEQEVKRLNGRFVYHALIEEPLKNAIQNHSESEKLWILNNGEVYVASRSGYDLLIGKISTALPDNADTRAEITQEITDEGLTVTDETDRLVIQW